MKYTIKLDNTSEQAQSILNMLFVLSKDYDFLQIYEEQENYSMTMEQEKEFDRRLAEVIKNPTVGKSWEEVESKLLSK